MESQLSNSASGKYVQFQLPNYGGEREHRSSLVGR
jgi:hypothetical protein